MRLHAHGIVGNFCIVSEADCLNTLPDTDGHDTSISAMTDIRMPTNNEQHSLNRKKHIHKSIVHIKAIGTQ